MSALTYEPKTLQYGRGDLNNISYTGSKESNIGQGMDGHDEPVLHAAFQTGTCLEAYTLRISC